MIVKVDGVVVYRNTQVGVQGPPGPPGEKGADGAPGPAGADGSNVVWRGAWDALEAYQALDGVQHHGSAWVATEGVQAGDEPGVAASWELWVSKGDPGTPGEPGAPGADGADGQDGADGREVELQKSATHIQWRYEGDPTWTDLVALIDLEGPQGPAGSDGADGREVELQVTATHIQWRLAGGTWQNLIALSELEGPQGPKGNPGEAGAPGVGVPAGGSTGQVLKKASGADFDTEWADESGGGGNPAWGDLTGTLSDQTDLQNALNAKADASSLATVATSGDYTDLSNRPTLGSAAAANTGDFATAAQGGKADTALQPGDALTALASTGATAGHVPKADGSGGIQWAAESGSGGGGVPATGFTAMEALEQSEYDALDPPDAATLYFVLEDSS